MPSPPAYPAETKFLPLDRGTAPGLAFKAAGDAPDGGDGIARVLGYASTFGGAPDSYGDVISPGAFAESIREWQRRSWRLPMLLNHDPAATVGVWSELNEDAIGLKVTGELTPGHRLAEDLAASLKHGAVSGLSIGYRTLRASEGPNGTRVLDELELFEISAVTHPANERARVTGVKCAAGVGTLRDLETVLRENLGWSHREAKAALRRVLDSLSLVDPDPTDGSARDERRAVAGGAVDPSASGERRDDGIAAANRLLAEVRGLRLSLPRF